MSTVLVTGATGFIGQALCRALRSHGLDVCAASREPPLSRENGIEYLNVGAIDSTTDWRVALAGKDTVVHLAARVHVMRESVADPLAEFRMVNVAGTERLAIAASEAGVRRLVYVSSIKVNGERTTGQLFTECDAPQPEDPYAQSKLEAENVLLRISAQTGLEVVVVRPPLVYGPGVKGNFLLLLRLVQLGLPLPLACCDNRRSFLALSNFTDFLYQCLDHPAAVRQTFLLSDGHDLSTPDLIRRIARALDRPARLLPMPRSWLKAGAGLLRKTDLFDRLCGSLQVDIGSAERLLGWTPPVSVDEELSNTARWFLREHARH